MASLYVKRWLYKARRRYFKSNIVKRSLRWVVSLKNFIQFSLHLLFTFTLLYKLPEYINTKEDVRDTIFIFIGICYAPFYYLDLYIYLHRKSILQRKKLCITYIIFLYVLLSLGIMFFTEYHIPDLLNAFPFQDKKYLFIWSLQWLERFFV